MDVEDFIKVLIFVNGCGGMIYIVCSFLVVGLFVEVLLIVLFFVCFDFVVCWLIDVRIIMRRIRFVLVSM